jgi:septum site-determining protein MinC
MLRGTKSGLEFVFPEEAGAPAFAEMSARLGERPEFYRGSRATAIFTGPPPENDGFAAFLETVRAHGIELHGVHGGDALAPFAAGFGLSYLGEAPRPVVTALEPRRPRKIPVEGLTERARSLDADFAGARADIARRRARGEASVPKPDFTPPASPAAQPVASAAAPAGPATLYHRGTLRGGQILQQIGNIVVVGDVNPGAELVASGDIVVFGALRGTAHAGAQGDASARVAALELAATQLRIAAFIAADDGKRKPARPEVAFVQNERIAIAPYGREGAR